MTPDILAPPRHTRSPWDIQRAVLFALFLRELRTRAGKNWMGVAWTLVEPLAQTLLLITVFGLLRHVASANMEFPVFLISGMMPFFLFRSLAQRLTEAIDTNRGLFSYRQVKPIDTVVARGLFESTLWLAVFVLTVATMVWAGFDAIPKKPLELMGAVGLSALLGFGLGLTMAVVTNDRPRLRTLVRMAYFPLYFFSGVIFSVAALPVVYQRWLLWNPMLHVVELSRNAFAPAHALMDGVTPLYPGTFGLVILASGLALYRRDRQKLLLGG